MMKKSIYMTTLSASVVLLAACGGGSVSSTQPGTSTTTTSAATTLGDCFTLTPGIKFINSNDFKTLIVQETFEGQTAFGVADLRADDTRSGVNYWTISGDDIHLLGINQYDQSGTLDGKNVYSSGAQFPANMVQGQTVQLNYTDTDTSYIANTTTVTNVSSQWTFDSLENLTLGGRLFTDVCKVKMTNGVSDQVDVIWFAKGFGAIRGETQDGQGNTITDSRIELTSIVTAP